jgi:uncharacterized protein YjdB
VDFGAGVRSARWDRATPSWALTGLLVAVAAGCSSATGVGGVTRIAVNPPSATLPVRDQLPLQASLIGGSGPPSGASVFWSTEDSSVALVSPTGVVTAMAPGVVRIAASAEGVSGTATITVPVTQVASVTVVPDTLRLTPTGAARLLATAYDGSGNIVNGLAVTWGSSNTTVAPVDQTGAVTAVSVGTSRVSASIGGKVASATVIVSAPQVATVLIVPDSLALAIGDVGHLQATAFDTRGNMIKGLPTTWGSGNAAVASVDGSGVVAGVGRGTATVTAAIGGKAGSATIVVGHPKGPPGK